MLPVVVLMLVAACEGVFDEYQNIEDDENDDADFDDHYDSEEITTTTTRSLDDTGRYRIRRFDDQASGARTLSLEEIQDVKDALKQLLAGRQLDNLTTVTETIGLEMRNDETTRDFFTGLTKITDSRDPTKFYDELIEEILDSAKKQGYLVTSNVGKTETNTKLGTQMDITSTRIMEITKYETTTKKTTTEYTAGEYLESTQRSSDEVQLQKYTQKATGEIPYHPKRTRGRSQINRDYEDRTTIEHTSGEHVESTQRSSDEVQSQKYTQKATGEIPYHPKRTRGKSQIIHDYKDSTTIEHTSREYLESTQKSPDGVQSQQYTQKATGEIPYHPKRTRGKSQINRVYEDRTEYFQRATHNYLGNTRFIHNLGAVPDWVNKFQKKLIPIIPTKTKPKLNNIRQSFEPAFRADGKEIKTPTRSSNIAVTETRNEDPEITIIEKIDHYNEGPDWVKKFPQSGNKSILRQGQVDFPGDIKFTVESTSTTTTTFAYSTARPHFYPFPYSSKVPPTPVYNASPTTWWRTRRRKTTTALSVAPQLDIPALVAIIANLTGDYESNITSMFNETLQKYNIPTCPSLEVTTEEVFYDLVNATVVAKCFVCGMNEEEIPRASYCADAFAPEFLPLVPIDPRSKQHLVQFRKYCRYLDVNNFYENQTEPRSVFGRFTGGCSVRWIDLSTVYTQRACRNRRRAMTGKHFASKRMAKLEMALNEVDNGCIISPMASLVPLSRGVSLFARFHACVCTGSWCNITPASEPWTAFTVIFALWTVSTIVSTLVQFAPIPSSL